MRDDEDMELTEFKGPHLESYNEEAWIRLAREVRQRRLELGYSQEDAYKQAGLGNVFWSKLENAKTRPKIAKRSAVDVERVLRWAPGSVAYILFDNGKPRELAPEERVGDLVEELQRNNELLVEMLTRLDRVEKSVETLKPVENLIRGLRA